MERSYFYLQQLDLAVFRFFNQDLVSGPGDLIARCLSSETILAVMSALVLLFALVKRRWDILRFLIVAGLLLGFVDAVSTFIFKPSFSRLRPCIAMPDTVRIISGCRSMYGFPSNHAANSMVLAVLVTILWQRKVGLALLGLAFFVGLSRVYLGVHYPSDVLFGFLFGGLTAAIVGLTLRRYTTWGSVNIRP